MSQLKLLEKEQEILFASLFLPYIWSGMTFSSVVQILLGRNKIPNLSCLEEILSYYRTENKYFKSFIYGDLKYYLVLWYLYLLAYLKQCCFLGYQSWCYQFSPFSVCLQRNILKVVEINLTSGNNCSLENANNLLGDLLMKVTKYHLQCEKNT